MYNFKNSIYIFLMFKMFTVSVKLQILKQWVKSYKALQLSKMVLKVIYKKYMELTE